MCFPVEQLCKREARMIRMKTERLYINTFLFSIPQDLKAPPLSSPLLLLLCRQIIILSSTAGEGWCLSKKPLSTSSSFSTLLKLHHAEKGVKILLMHSPICPLSTSLPVSSCNFTFSLLLLPSSFTSHCYEYH